MFLSSCRKNDKKRFFQNSDAYLVKFRCENSYISSLYNSLHLPSFAGLSTDSITLNPLDSKNICHSWAKSGEIGLKVNF